MVIGFEFEMEIAFLPLHAFSPFAAFYSHIFIN